MKCEPCESGSMQQLNGSRGGGGRVSEGKIRFIRKFCIGALVMKMEEDNVSAKMAEQRLAERWHREGVRPETDIVKESINKKE